MYLDKLSTQGRVGGGFNTGGLYLDKLSTQGRVGCI